MMMKMMQQLFFPHTKKVPNNMIIIPNDVIIEILSWLPAKSLLRLRWTCKYWFDLICNRDVHDDFIKMHLHRSTAISPWVLSFYFMNCLGGKLSQCYYLNYNNDDSNHYAVVSSSEVIRIDHPSVKEEYIHTILGSCNGLILLRLLSNKYLHCTWHMCILNPCTKEYRLLRGPMNSSYRETYGFGYDETMDDYKVIRVFRYDQMYMGDDDDDLSQYSEVEVYTLGKDSWRRCIGPCPYQLSSSAGAGVFMNGALYWMDIEYENIISFDIGKEEFRHVAKIPNLIGYRIQVFEGSLCMVLSKSLAKSAEIWVMKDYTVNNNNESVWTKLLTIPNANIQGFPIKAVRYKRNGEILILNSNKDLVLYDPNNTSDPKTLHRIKENRNLSMSLEAYTESLVPLNSGTYARIEADKELQET